MTANVFALLLSMLAIVKGAIWSTHQTEKLAKGLRLSGYAAGFIIVAFISILPETLVSINAAAAGIPAFGLATLLGSNIADLTLVFTILVLATGRSIKVENKILREIRFYPILLLLPVLLGADGGFSRFEGLAMLSVGLAYYLYVLRDGKNSRARSATRSKWLLSAILLAGSLGVLLIGSHYAVYFASLLAGDLGVSPILIGLLVVGLGTTMPELFFSLRAAKYGGDSLAVGDILGTVLADATIVVGLLATIKPFVFPVQIIYLTGITMFAASIALVHCIKTGRSISRREAYLLFFLWLIYILAEAAIAV